MDAELLNRVEQEIISGFEDRDATNIESSKYVIYFCINCFLLDNWKVVNIATACKGFSNKRAISMNFTFEAVIFWNSTNTNASTTLSNY